MNVYWLEQTEADVPSENDWLSEKEALFLDTLRFAKRRADWRLGRWTAKCALSVYLDVPGHLDLFKKLEIRPAPSGSPEVFFDELAAPVTISLSHRAGRAICAVAMSGVKLGCDLEIVEPRSDAFVADYLTVEEQALVADTAAADRDRLLALVWSAKESALKALGAGLRLDARCVIVNPIVESFDLISWSPLQVRHTGGRDSGDRCTKDRCPEDQLFQGWWQHAGVIMRTVVAEPAPNLPIPLRTTGHPFHRASQFA
ncbi:MAG: 4'-phosphopantetheinyl transferase superfamily protein [Terriglobales bacterium]